MTQRICEVESCGGAHQARGLCMSHYVEAKKAGALPPLKPRPLPPHNLDDADLAALVADCDACGPRVPIVVLRGGDVVKCKARHRLDRERIQARRKERAETEPGFRGRRNAYHARYARLKKYGLSKGGLEELLAGADSACEICQQPLNLNTMRIDHDHSCCDGSTYTCGKCVRGVLCNRCNTAIGMAGDDPLRLLRAARYLVSNRSSVALKPPPQGL